MKKILFVIIAFLISHTTFAGYLDNAQRVQIQKGKNKTIIKGILKDDAHPTDYLIDVKENQKISVKLIPTVSEAAAYLEIYEPYSGEQLVAQNQKLHWEGVLKESGDYVIRVAAAKPKGTYVLEIEIH